MLKPFPIKKPIALSSDSADFSARIRARYDKNGISDFGAVSFVFLDNPSGASVQVTQVQQEVQLAVRLLLQLQQAYQTTVFLPYPTDAKAYVEPMLLQCMERLAVLSHSSYERLRQYYIAIEREAKQQRTVLLSETERTEHTALSEQTVIRQSDAAKTPYLGRQAKPLPQAAQNMQVESVMQAQTPQAGKHSKPPIARVTQASDKIQARHDTAGKDIPPQAASIDKQPQHTAAYPAFTAWDTQERRTGLRESLWQEWHAILQTGQLLPQPPAGLPSALGQTIPQERNKVPYVFRQTIQQEGQKVPYVFRQTIPQEGQKVPYVFRQAIPQEGQKVPSVFGQTIPQEGQKMPSVFGQTIPQEGQKVPSAFGRAIPQEGQKVPSVFGQTIPQEGKKVPSAFGRAIPQEGQKVPSAFERAIPQDSRKKPHRITAQSIKGIQQQTPASTLLQSRIAALSIRQQQILYARLQGISPVLTQILTPEDYQTLPREHVVQVLCRNLWNSTATEFAAFQQAFLTQKQPFLSAYRKDRDTLSHTMAQAWTQLLKTLSEAQKETLVTQVTAAIPQTDSPKKTEQDSQTVQKPLFAFQNVAVTHAMIAQMRRSFAQDTALQKKITHLLRKQQIQEKQLAISYLQQYTADFSPEILQTWDTLLVNQTTRQNVQAFLKALPPQTAIAEKLQFFVQHSTLLQQKRLEKQLDWLQKEETKPQTLPPKAAYPLSGKAFVYPKTVHLQPDKRTQGQTSQTEQPNRGDLVQNFSQMQENSAVSMLQSFPQMQSHNAVSLMQSFPQMEKNSVVSLLQSFPQMQSHNAVSLMQSFPQIQSHNVVSLMQSFPQMEKNSVVSLMQSFPQMEKNSAVSLMQSFPQIQKNSVVSLMQSFPQMQENSAVSLVQSFPQMQRNNAVSLIMRSFPQMQKNNAVSLIMRSFPQMEKNSVVSLMQSFPQMQNDNAVSLIMRSFPQMEKNSAVSLMQSFPQMQENNAVSLMQSFQQMQENNAVSLMRSFPQMQKNSAVSLIMRSFSQMQENSAVSLTQMEKNNAVSLVQSFPQIQKNSAVSLMQSFPQMQNDNAVSLIMRSFPQMERNNAVSLVQSFPQTQNLTQQTAVFPSGTEHPFVFQMDNDFPVPQTPVRIYPKTAVYLQQLLTQIHRQSLVRPSSHYAGQKTLVFHAGRAHVLQQQPQGTIPKRVLQQSMPPEQMQEPPAASAVPPAQGTQNTAYSAAILQNPGVSLQYHNNHAPANPPQTPQTITVPPAKMEWLQTQTVQTEQSLTQQAQTLKTIQTELQVQKKLVQELCAKQNRTPLQQRAETRRLVRAVMADMEQELRLERQRRGL